MDKIHERTLLYDFYGELLTDNQKTIYELYYLDDLSLSEISEQSSISRQGVHDTLKKADKQLDKFEGKLKLVERYANIKHMAYHIDVIAHEIEDAISDEATITKAESLTTLTRQLIKSL